MHDADIYFLNMCNLMVDMICYFDMEISDVTRKDLSPMLPFLIDDN